MYQEIENGTFEEIQGLKCWIPPQPKDSDIQGYLLEPASQKWQRTELPDFDQSEVDIFSGTEYPRNYRLTWDEAKREELIKQTGFDPWDPSDNPKRVIEDFDEFYFNEKMEEFRLQEFGRIKDGHWVFINGKAIYLTGDYYFYINWWKLNTGYAEFRDTDRQLFYFWEFVKQDPRCYGLLEITKRGQGKSYRMGCIAYLRCIFFKGAHIGIQSKNDTDSGAFFKTKVVEPYKELPEFLVPINNHGTEPQSGFQFFPPSRRTAKARFVKKVEAIRSWMDFRSATNNAYDSTTCKFLVQDEIAKIEPKIGDAEKRIGICKEVVFRDNKMIGKMWCSSTVEDMKKGGAKVESLWDKSNLDKRSDNGTTVSGLYPFFLSAIECTIFDQYGYPDRIAAKKKHDAERKNKENDPTGYTLYIQQNPYTIKEAFRSTGADCLYNSKVLIERESICGETNPTRKGNFVWENDKPFTKAIWKFDDNGKFEVSWLFPEDRYSNHVSKLTLDGKDYHSPLNDVKFALAYDPFSHSKTVFEKRRSNAGAAVFRNFDFWDEENSETFVADYVARPQDPEDAHMDILCMAWYYGCQVLCESQKNSFMDWCKRNGVYDFVMLRPLATMPEGGAQTEGIPSSEKVIDIYIQTMQTHIDKYGYKLKHLRIIKDLLPFDSAKRYKFDLGVACQLTLLAANRPYSEKSGADQEEAFDVAAIA